MVEGVRTVTADPIVEAREKVDFVSFLEEVRGNVKPNKKLLLDGMSAVLAHEQNGVQLYQKYSQDTKNPQFKEVWHEFGEETRVHQQVAERVITALGGDPSHRSPVARDIDRIDKTLLNVEAQGDEGDLVRLGNLMLAGTLCKHHWKGVSTLARRIQDPAMAKVFKDASRIVERDEDMHVHWNAIAYDRQLEKVTTGM